MKWVAISCNYCKFVLLMIQIFIVYFRKNGKYSSLQIQNEMIKIMSNDVLRTVASVQEANYFALMAD